MRHVPFSVYFAAHRLGLVAGAGGRRVHRAPLELPSLATPDSEYSVAEFNTPAGEVLCRRVDACGQTQCWLRADLADAAERAVRAEAAEQARIAAAVIGWSLGHDEARAAEQGVSLEEYRSQRNHSLARIDARRGVNSRGMR